MMIYKLIYQQTISALILSLLTKCLYKSVIYKTFRKLKFTFNRNLTEFWSTPKTVHNFHAKNY